MNNSVRIGLALGGGVLAALSWFLMRWDQIILNGIYLRPLGALNAVRIIGWAGSWMVLIPVVILALTVFMRPGWTWLAIRPIAALVVAEGIAEGLKIFLHRPRPLTIAQTDDFWGYSFPSEHALAGLAVWFALAQVMGKLWPDSKAPILAAASILSVLIGWSQIHMGVNWPADVVAGWAFALILIAAAPGPYPPQAGRVKKKGPS